MKFLAFDAEVKFLDESAGKIEGYASVFNLIDQGGDTVLPGAFKDTIKRNAKTGIPMLYQHNPYDQIGQWTGMSEDDKGLRVTGELGLGMNNPSAEKTYGLMKKGWMKGLSIGYRTVNAGIDKATGARQLKTVDLYEISPVTFPMQREAGITNVKGEYAFDSEFDERKIERALRDAGLSNKDAKIGVAVFKKMAFRDGTLAADELRDASSDAFKDMLMSLRKATAEIGA